MATSAVICFVSIEKPINQTIAKIWSRTKLRIYVEMHPKIRPSLSPSVGKTFEKYGKMRFRLWNGNKNEKSARASCYIDREYSWNNKHILTS